MNRRGFTIVELIIVMAIMGILLVLGVVNLRGSQASARDDERRTDVESIGIQLDIFYKNGTTGSTITGRYPSTGLVGNAITVNLRDADTKAFMAPGAADLNSSFVAATNNTQSVTGVAPSPEINRYVYQPLQQDGTLCTSSPANQMCQKYNIYYKRENAAISPQCPSPGYACMVTSKNQ